MVTKFEQLADITTPLPFIPPAPPPPDPPDPPTGLSATAGDTEIQLEWDITEFALTYNVKRSLVLGGPYTTIASTIDPEYTDTDLINGVTYYYVVSAVNGFGESANSSEVNATPVAPPPPDPPTGLTATAGNTEIELGWNASAGATSYNIKRSLVGGGPYTTIASTTLIAYTNTGLTNGTPYFYVVTAVNQDGESGNSNEATATPTAPPPPQPPDPPTGLTATAGDAEVNLNWDDTFNALTYNVKRSLISGGPYTTIASPSVSNYLNTGLTNGTTYYYVVSAVNADGESANSSQVSATPTVPPPSPPPTPTGVAAEAGNARIRVSWNTSSGATGYKVKRSLVSGGPYTTIATPTGTHFNNLGLTNGVTYYYVVSATNANGESANSLEVNATPTAGTPPPAPTGLVATPGNTQISLSWNESVGATSYNVKRSLIMGGPYSTIANVATTSYLNTGLTNGTPYFYVVSALNGAGESGNSNEATATPTTPPPEISLRGVVVFGGTSLDPDVLANSDVDGCVARVDWGELETAAGVFDWTSLDAQVADIVAAGKKLLLGVATGGDILSAGGHKPNWLYPLITANGGTFFTFLQDGEQVTIPVHWDTTLLSRKASMIAAVGARYASDPVVCVRFNYMNAHSEDYNPGATNNTPDGFPPLGSTPQSRWLAAGWTEAKLIAAGNTTFAAYNSAFPNAFLEIAIGKITNANLAPSGANFVNDTVIATARTNYPNRIFATKNSLTARTPDAPGTGEWLHLWNLRPCATQMLWHAFNDPTFRMGDNDPETNLTDAINKGAGYQNQWEEIYEIDVLNLPNVIHYAHLLLNP